MGASGQEESAASAPTRDFLRQVLGKAISAQGFAYIAAVFGIVVLVATAAKFGGVSPGTLALGVIAFVALAGLYFVFSRAVRLSHKQTSMMAITFLWAVTLIAIATLGVACSSAVFNTPLPGRTALLVWLGTARNERALVTSMTGEHIRENVDRPISRIIISETNTPPSQTTNRLADFLRRERPGIGYHFIVDRQGYPYLDFGHLPLT